MTYITHGEPAAADALRFQIEHKLNWAVRLPEHLETVRLDAEEQPWCRTRGQRPRLAELRQIRAAEPPED